MPEGMLVQMKILFVGSAGSKYLGARYYDSIHRFVNGLVRNGHFVWLFSDRDELITHSPLGIRPIGKMRVNTRLLAVAKQLRPDAVLLLNAEIINNFTLLQLKEMLPALRIAQLNIDAIFNEFNRARFTERKRAVDMQFFTTGGVALRAFSTLESPCYFIPNPVDSSIDVGSAFEHEVPRHDLACTMTVNPRMIDSDYRVNVANTIASELPNLKLAYRGFNGQPMVRGAEYIDIYANSGMSLSLSQSIADNSFSKPEERYLYSSDRIAHITGNGSLAVVQNLFQLHELYPHDAAIFYDETGELIEKLTFFHGNPAARQAVARRGWEKAHSAFNNVLTTRYILERLFKRPLSTHYEWPVDAW